MSDNEKSFTDQEALRFHTRGKPGKLEISPTKPMAHSAIFRLLILPALRCR
jgi:malate dehydrogenase (oxaloacetate-decarboxylating)(NADP+)